jgi:hypothetical protein
LPTTWSNKQADQLSALACPPAAQQEKAVPQNETGDFVPQFDGK